jgi:DNA-binding NarL/FixJ family response regulator
MTTKVMIVDDHPLMRQGLRQALERQPHLAIVAECSNGYEALQSVQRLAPDLVIMDVHLPDLSGVEVSRRILAEIPGVKVVILSADSDRELVDEALEVGVSGYLLKSGVVDELARAVSMAVEGRLYLSPEVASIVLGDYRRMLVAGRSPMRPVLTERERQVLRYVAEGLQNKEVACQLNISPKAAERTRARIMDKLGYRSVAELTRYAIREGIIQG